MSKRVITIVTDSFGIGALPDAEQYGDAHTSTIGSIASRKPDFQVPTLQKLGLFNIDGVQETLQEKGAFSNEGCRPAEAPMGAFGRMHEGSAGKDSTTGHWEIAGLITDVPFRTFEAFPQSFLDAFSARVGHGCIGNCKASGTAIIEELGPRQRETGDLIVYTSADSVFQIAADKAVIPLEELYRICETAREMLVGELAVARVIARPYEHYPENEGKGFLGGEYLRTAERKDYSVDPPAATLLDFVKNAGLPMYAVGKINDLFNGIGITGGVHTESNDDGMNQTLLAMDNVPEGFIFTNLVDFDTQYGHRRKPVEYGMALENFDKRLTEVLSKLKTDDLLIITADHGNDPCHTGWDHTREYVPLLVFGPAVKGNVNLGTRSTFADVAATVAEYLNVQMPENGTSFLKEIL